MKRKTLLTIAVAGLSAALYAQQSNIAGKVKGTPQIPSIAAPDLRGSGQAQQFMGTFNNTLYHDLSTSGQVKVIARTLYPLQVPQQPSDIRPTSGQGLALIDWSGPPPNANYLAFGYTAVQNNQIVLYGWLDDVRQSTPTSAQIFGKVYLGSLDEAGARSVAQQFAADILKQFGAASLLGTRIYFVSDRTGHKEIWSMNYDGSDQRAFTHYGTITTFPAVSADGTKIAFMSYPLLASSRRPEAAQFGVQNQNLGQPVIYVHSLETGRKLVYYNQHASMNAPSDFMPDSRHLLIYSTANGGVSQIYETDLDGSDLKRITHTQSLEVEPKVNPKTGMDVVFLSGRGGNPQIYRMNLDGTDVARLTDGQGDCANPAWSPDGEHIAFSWTRGYEPGNYNIFVMDVASRTFVQLTHGAGRNENPSWAPDGIHIVFSSNRSGREELYSMTADGNNVEQLTRQGNNEKPVWTKAAQ